MRQSTDVTTTLERGLCVLRALRAERAPLTNSELVRRTGLPRSTVSRLTMTLVRLGFLRRVPGGRQLELSSDALGIGQTYLETNPVTRLAHPFMQQLADRLNVCVALSVPNGLDMLYIAYRSSARIVTLRRGVGSLVPMGLTATGRAWLWALPAAARSEYIASIMQAAGAQTEGMIKGIDTAFEELQTTGACMSLNEYQRDSYGVALPVFVGRSSVRMTLSCGAVEPNPDIEDIRQRIVPEPKAAAMELTILLRDAKTPDTPFATAQTGHGWTD